MMIGFRKAICLGSHARGRRHSRAEALRQVLIQLHQIIPSLEPLLVQSPVELSAPTTRWLPHYTPCLPQGVLPPCFVPEAAAPKFEYRLICNLRSVTSPWICNSQWILDCASREWSGPAFPEKIAEHTDLHQSDLLDALE